MRVSLWRAAFFTGAALPLLLAACGSPSSAAGSAGPLNIGVLYPFTGSNAIQGIGHMAGCLAGIKPVNDAGGVLGHTLRCVSADTKGDPADAVTTADKLLASSSPVMVMGPSDDAVATSPIVEAAHITNFPTVGDPHFDHQASAYFWRVTPSDSLQGIALGYWAATHGLTHAASVFTSDLGAQTSVPPLRAEYARLGGRFAVDLTLAPGQASYRSEVVKVLQARPDAVITEMDAQSEATFLSELQQIGGKLPLIISTLRATNSDWMTAVRGAIGTTAMRQDVKVIIPYLHLGGPPYASYKSALLSLKGQTPDPGQWITQPYVIADFDVVSITALAMTEARSTDPGVYNSYISKVLAPSPGATVVSTYASGIAALKAGHTIQYVGASGPLVFNRWHSVGRAFVYCSYDQAAQGFQPVTVIPGTALGS